MTEFKDISNVTTSICGKLFRWKGSPIFQEPWIIELSQSVETFIMVSISDIPTVSIGKMWVFFWIKQKRRFLNNAGLVIHVLRHWQLL